MNYQHKPTREADPGALRRDVVALRRKIEQVEFSSTITVNQDDIVRARGANSRNRARMRKIETRLDKQAAMIDQLQLMVEQLIRRGSTPCPEQCCSPERQSPSS